MKTVELVAAVLLAAFAVISLHYYNEIRLARKQTPELVQTAFAKFGREVSASQLPPRRIDMLLQIEDPTFNTNRGVDLETPGAGMTTIAQGLVKILYFPQGFKQGIAKIRQTLIADYAFNALVPKSEQLDLYLNATYFGTVDGTPVHGLAQASQVYFNKPYSALSDDQFLALVGMTISPNRLKPHTQESAQRVERAKQYLAGAIAPASVLDVEYTGKLSGTRSEEAMMSVLRVLTHATPATN